MNDKWAVIQGALKIGFMVPRTEAVVGQTIPVVTGNGVMFYEVVRIIPNHNTVFVK